MPPAHLDSLHPLCSLFSRIREVGRGEGERREGEGGREERGREKVVREGERGIEE